MPDKETGIMELRKIFSQACERNSEPICAVLKHAFADCKHVLEIGSGTGQHAVYFAARLPHLIWQASDLPENHPSILAWRKEAALPNLPPPLALDVLQPDAQWPQTRFDAAFSANTLHIMSWTAVEAMFAGLGRVLREAGVLCIYGPFNYGGAYTSDGNARFDAVLRAQSAQMGIRDIEQVLRLAEGQGLELLADHAMPANNRLLVWRAGAQQKPAH